MIFKPKLPAFTLTELLVVLAIIGILVMIALPKIMPLISRAKSAEAKLQLQHLHTLQQTYFYINSKYSDSFSEIGFEHEKLTTDGGNANYQVEIVEASGTGFKALATAVVDFDKDGVFNVWQVDQDKNIKEVMPD